MKKLEYINQKNQDQLKLYQELKYVKANKDKVENMQIKYRNKGTQTMVTKTFSSHRKKSARRDDSYQDVSIDQELKNIQD